MAPTQSRSIDARELNHNTLAEQGTADAWNYDTSRRLDILVDEFFKNMDLTGKEVLDVGCGLGYFSERMVQRGAKVLCTDLGPELVQTTIKRAGCDGIIADALNLKQALGDKRFDIVISSECIEHTPNPYQAARSMCEVLKPGGYLSISTPNLPWQPVVRMATKLKLRKYDCLENFSSWSGLTRAIETSDMHILERQGCHLFPFQFKMHGLSTWCDRRFQALRAMMINICILAQKN